MAKVIGNVDDLGRPVVRLEFPNGEGCLAVVDTGFNRSILLLATQAAAFGFVIEQNTEAVELATTVRVEVRRAIGTILWLGRAVTVDALISNEAASIHRPDVARALIGTELLNGCLLLVDFVAGSAEIELQA